MSHDFRPDQLRAITATGRTLVAAAAGSGKTSVLTERIARALLDGVAAPSEILAVTYTRKAAQEMRERLAHRIQESNSHRAPELVAQLQLATIGTIHSMCSDILRRFGTTIGVDPGFTVLEEQHSTWLREQAFDQLLATATPESDLDRLRSILGDDTLREQIYRLDVLAQRRIARDISFIDFVDISIDDADIQPAVARLVYDELPRAFTTWANLLADGERRVGGLGFGSLEQLALQLVSDHPEILTELRARWTHVLVDEFQDTNDVQYELLNAIADSRLFMVGDEWQSIYRFRGANVDVFRARRTEVGDGLHPMRENFRSAPSILGVVNHIFAHEDVFGEAYEPVEPGGTRDDATGASVELLMLPSKHDDDSPYAGLDGRELMAQRVADRIVQLVETGEIHFGIRDDGTPGTSVAMLWQAGTGADTFESALRARGIPIIRGKAKGFYDRPDVRDVMQVLALVRNRLDDRAALGVLSGPLASCSWQQLLDVRAAAGGPTEPFWPAIVASTEPAVMRVRALIDDLDLLARDASLVEVIERITEIDEFVAFAATGATPRLRLANLRKLVQVAASAAGVGIVDVPGFLDYVAAQRRDGQEGDASIAGEDAGAVQLMSIHASKGLEFDHVFVLDMQSPGRSERQFPLADEHGCIELPVPKVDGKLAATTGLTILRDNEKLREYDERLRKYYVAFTRAKQRLYIGACFDQTPKKDGTPKALRGDLKWLAAALDLPDFLDAGPTGTCTMLNGRALLDTRLPEIDQSPRPDLFDTPRAAHLATPIWGAARATAASASEPSMQASEASPDEQAAMHQRLVSLAGQPTDTSDGRDLLHGERLHAAIAAVLESVDSAATNASAEAALSASTMSINPSIAALASSPLVAQLKSIGARAEVPFLLPIESGEVRVGRFDALATLADGTWWIVDWKSSLPDSHLAAWADHGPQLTGYVEAARAAGASGAVLTLASLLNPDVVYTWRVSSVDADAPDFMCDLPVLTARPPN